MLTTLATLHRYMAIPFLWELRAAIDWTIETTSLDLMAYLKLEDIYGGLTAVRADMDKATRRQYNTLLTLCNEQMSVLDELSAASRPQNIWDKEMKFYTSDVSLPARMQTRGLFTCLLPLCC